MRTGLKSGISQWYTGTTPLVEGESTTLLIGSGRKEEVDYITGYFDGMFYRFTVFNELFTDAELNEFLQGDTE